MVTAVLREIVNAERLSILHVNVTGMITWPNDFAFEIAGKSDRERYDADEQRSRFLHDQFESIL
jgi:hypothetical protein